MPLAIIPPRTDIQITVVANSLENIFKKSLRGMAHELKKGGCSASSQSDYTIKVYASAKGYKGLLVDFLTKVLALTHAQHTIFCAMYIEELTEHRLVAQLYGKWFDNFDNKIKAVVEQGFKVEKKEDRYYMGSLVFGI
ncbi:archease [Maribacter sp.]|uniref:archease n=1 Tax=Maribacter sp. TaxID=1897614 RepID=UPI0025C55161|nr:archease [Maribacter sp.]